MNKSNLSDLSNEKFTAEEMKRYPQMLQDSCVKSTEIMKKLQAMNKSRCNLKGNTQRDTINNKRLCYDDINKEIVAKLDAESNCVMSKLINSKLKLTSKSTSSIPSKYYKSYKSLLAQNKSVKQVPIPSKLVVPLTKSVSPVVKVSKSVSSKSVSASSAKSTSIGSVSKSVSSSRDQIPKTQSQSQNLKPDEGPDFINQFFIPAYDSKRAAAFSSFTLDVPIGTSHKYRAIDQVSTYDDASRLSDPGFLYQLAGYKKIKELDGLEYKPSNRN